MPDTTTPTRGSAASTPPATGGRQRPRLTWKWLVTVLVLLLANYVLASVFLPAPTTQRVAIPYTLFKQQVDAGNVAAITASGDQIQGRFKQPVSYTAPNTSQAVSVAAFSTVQPTFSDPGLETQLEQQGVVVNATSLDQTTPW